MLHAQNHKHAIRAQIHHALKHQIGRGTGRDIFEHDVADVGDALAVTLALTLIGAGAIGIEHALKINADIAFTVGSAAGVHPLSYVLRRFL